MWWQERMVHSTPRFVKALTKMKMMVCVSQQISAWLVEQKSNLLVKLEDTGAYPGLEFCPSRA